MKDKKEERCTCDVPCHNLRGWSGECKCGCKKCDPKVKDAEN